MERKNILGGLVSKKLILIFIALTFIFSGCEAFKDYYDQPTEVDEHSDISDKKPIQNSESSLSNEQSELNVNNYADSTVCVQDGTVKVEYNYTEDTRNDGWSIGAETSGEALGDNTYILNLTKDTGTLSITIKQVTAEEFSICSIVYNGCDGECVGGTSMWTSIEEAKVVIHQFNRDGMFDVFYDILFGVSSQGDLGFEISGEFTVEKDNE